MRFFSNTTLENQVCRPKSGINLYPFGSPMPGRQFTSSADDYRYGFNGKENDDETGTQDYGMRIYNPALGKFLSIDPLSKKYPYLTPYAFAENDVIRCIDLDGEEKYVVTQYRDEQGKITKIRIHSATNSEGQAMDQHLVLNGVDYSGSEILVKDVTLNGETIGKPKTMTKFNRIQQKVFNDNGSTIKPIVREDNTAVARDDNGEHTVEGATKVDRQEADIMSTEFVFVRPSGVSTPLALKEITEKLNSGEQIMNGDTKPKLIDEIQYEGVKSKVLKTQVSPTLNEAAKSKENKANVPKKGMTQVKLRNYDIQKKK